MRRRRRLRAMSLRPSCPGGAWPGAEGGERPPGPGLTHGPAAAAAAAAAGAAPGAVPRPAPGGSAPPAAPARAAAAPRGWSRGSGGAGLGGAGAGGALGAAPAGCKVKSGLKALSGAGEARVSSSCRGML